jgi:microcystin degradation protein MlrC
MRIAVGGLHVECCTYNPVQIVDDDFVIWRGEEILTKPYFDVLGSHEATYLPTFYARAVPGGQVAAATYARFKQEMLERLAAHGPVDGVYMAMHGAVKVDGMWDAEGDWLTAIREVVGPDCVIAVSYDLHGNVTQEILDAIDIFSTYRTAPHIDVRETQLRSLAMLHRALNSGERPLIAWVKVPMLMGGERTSTRYEPAKSIYAGLPELDALPGVWDASLQVGYRSADEPRATACSVFTGTDARVLEAEAVKLAQRYWDVRFECNFPVPTGGVEEGVALAARSATHPVILADSGDNPTAGGVGDRGDVLAEVLKQRLANTVVAGITDRPAVDKAYAAGVGARLQNLKIGGSLDPRSPSITVDVEVIKLVDAADAAEREAVVRIGGVSIVLAARRRPYHNIADFERVGFDPLQLDTILVKSGYLSPELEPIAKPNFMILTDGAVTQEHLAMKREHMAVPTFPWFRDATFTPSPAFSKRSLARMQA